MSRVNPENFQQTRIQQASIAVALTFVVLAIIGAFRQYTPVPYMDMWDGYIGFYLQVLQGNAGAWWAQHNEHRILLTRGFFWMDLAWFDGRGWSLILVNYLLVGFGAYTFYRFICVHSTIQSRSGWRVYLTALSTLLMFSWVQRDNLVWGFQIQFILAQLLPLFAFYCMQRAIQITAFVTSTVAFAMACLAGVLALGTMANGVLTLPLLLFYALIERQSIWRVLSLLSLSVLGLLIYFWHYHRPVAHGDVIQTIVGHPFEFIQYILLYIGAPFYRFFMGGYAGKIMAYLAGLTLITGAAAMAWQRVREPNGQRELGLLFFILYVGGTAAATAGARLLFGLDSALAGRYTTPTLMAWAAFLILSSHYWLPKLLRPLKWLRMGLGLLLVLMLISQFKALRNAEEKTLDQWVAALALGLNIRDDEQIKTIYPEPDRVRLTALQAAAQRLSIFNDPRIAKAPEQIGAFIEIPHGAVCPESSGHVYALDHEDAYLRVDGWFVHDERSLSPPVLLLIHPEEGRVVGYVLTFSAFRKNAPAVNPGQSALFYKGYLYKDAVGKDIILQAEGSAECNHLALLNHPG